MPARATLFRVDLGFHTGFQLDDPLETHHCCTDSDAPSAPKPEPSTLPKYLKQHCYCLASGWAAELAKEGS